MNTKNYSFGLIGFPLDHTLSPKLHKAALRATGLDGSYSLYPVAPLPDGQSTLESILQKMRQGKIHGLNVTIPHKQNVLTQLDGLTPTADAIGAVNTIFQEGDRLIGDNTDAPAFLTDLQHCLTDHLQLVEGNQSALILGAGGAARAVSYALLGAGWRVLVASRRHVQALTLAEDLICRGINKAQPSISTIPLSPSHLPRITSSVTLLVNATPLGMAPNTGSSPWPIEIALPAQAAVYDLVYNPSKTLLVSQAQDAGLPATTGIGMLIEQAALAFERWTGHDVPRANLRKMIKLN